MMRTIVVVGACLALAGCTLDKAEAPALTGPSEYALSVTLSASPDQLPRDGNSQSTITILVRDAAGQPVSGQRLNVHSTVGRVSTANVTTAGNGQASFTYTAPPAGTIGNFATIEAVPVSSDAANSIGRTVLIRLTGGPNTTAPTPAFTVTPEAPEVNTSVRFDASTTTDEGAPCLDTCSYLWNFGDGTTRTGRIVTHTYRAARVYTVTLTVTDQAQTTASIARVITVASVAAPSVTLAVAPNPPLAGQLATFTANTTVAPNHSIVQYDWNFGDGTVQTTTSRTVTKSYASTGTYVVTVTATDDVGQTASASVSFTIVGSGVTSNFTYSPTAPVVGQTVQFNGSGSTGSAGSSIVTWAWDFGNGSTATGVDASIAYAAAGTYNVRLTVTDSAGRTGTSTQQVAVK